MSTALTRMPRQFRAGTTLSYTRTLTDYPASAGWALKVYLAGAGVVNATAVASGDDFVVTFAASDTANLGAGSYRFFEQVTKSGVVKDVGYGQVELLRNLATATGNAAQSFDERILAAIEALMEHRATKDQEEMQIDNVALKRIPWDDLARWRDIYAARVARRRARGAPMKVHRIGFSSPGG